VCVIYLEQAFAHVYILVFIMCYFVYDINSYQIVE